MLMRSRPNRKPTLPNSSLMPGTPPSSLSHCLGHTFTIAFIPLIDFAADTRLRPTVLVGFAIINPSHPPRKLASAREVNMSTSTPMSKPGAPSSFDDGSLPIPPLRRFLTYRIESRIRFPAWPFERSCAPLTNLFATRDSKSIAL